MLSKFFSPRYNLVFILLLVLFFGLYSFLAWSTIWPLARDFNHFIFNWPDENANYFFAEIFAQQGKLFAPEYLNVLSDNLLHTRSINVVSANLVPIGFLPILIIFGLFFAGLGPFYVLFLTPLLALITVYIIYRLVYLIFGDIKLALVSALLLLSLAPWLYFANFSFLPTVLFIFLLSAGYWSWAHSLVVGDKPGVYWHLGTLFLSLALVSRLSEILWVAFITFFIIYLYRSRLGIRRMAGSLLIFLGVAIWSLWLNQITYGHYLSFGYLDFQQTEAWPNEFKMGNGGQGILKWLALLFTPFGFKASLIIYNFYHYFIRIVLYKFILAGLGILLMYFKFRKNGWPLVWRRYFTLLVPVFVLILLYYGSWDLADPLVKSLNTLSISYVRYFMPLYILLLPLAAWTLITIFWQNTKIGRWAFYFLVFTLSLVSVRGAFIVHPDGLLDTRQTLIGYYQQFAAVKNIAPPDSIIITTREDKIFFPYYKVVAPQGDQTLWPRVLPLLDHRAVYYYSEKNDEEIAVDRQEADQVNLELAEPVNIWGNFRLFKIIKKP